MPYVGEHSVRINDPQKYEQIYRENNEFGKGIHVLYGTIGDKSEVQSIRFSTEQFESIDKVKGWLMSNGYDLKDTLEIEEAKKEKKGDSQKRFDAIEYGEVNIDKNGEIVSNPIVTKCGVFEYEFEDGTTRRELKPPEELLSADSLKTLSMLPVTITHPDGGEINPANAKSESVGFSGENAKVDGTHVSTKVKINTETGIEAVNNGVNYISLGFEANIDETAGEYDGVKYDAVQRNIRYNHIALTPSPRVGNVAKIKIGGDSKSTNIIEQKEKKGDSMGTIKLDSGVEYKVDAEVESEINSLRKKRDSLEQSYNDVVKEKENLQGKYDSLAEEKKNLEAEIPKRVDAKVKLLSEVANYLGDELKTDASEHEIKKQVIQKRNPEAKLDNASEGFIDGRYSGVIEQIKEEQKQDAENERQISGDETTPRGDAVEEARKEMLKDLQDSWKGDE